MRGYRFGTLAYGLMSMTHAWWPKSAGMLIAEANGRRIKRRGGLGGGSQAEDGGCEPAGDNGGKSEPVHCDAPLTQLVTYSDG